MRIKRRDVQACRCSVCQTGNKLGPYAEQVKEGTIGVEELLIKNQRKPEVNAYHSLYVTQRCRHSSFNDFTVLLVSVCYTALESTPGDATVESCMEQALGSLISKQ